MMYWNQVENKITIKLDRLEPKHMMYWNPIKSVAPLIGAVTWTKTYDVLKLEWAY